MDYSKGVSLKFNIIFRFQIIPNVLLPYLKMLRIEKKDRRELLHKWFQIKLPIKVVTLDKELEVLIIEIVKISKKTIQ